MMQVWDATITGSVLDLDHNGAKCQTNNPKCFCVFLEHPEQLLLACFHF